MLSIRDASRKQNRLYTVGVWRTYRLSPQGVTLTRDLCAEFEIWSPDIWSALLLQMIKFLMLGELRPTLKLLNR